MRNAVKSFTVIDDIDHNYFFMETASERFLNEMRHNLEADTDIERSNVDAFIDMISELFEVFDGAT